MTRGSNSTLSLLLGFDMRRPPPLAASKLSADYLLWPSAWDSETTEWRGPVQGLWDSYSRLEKSAKSHSGHWWVVAIYVELGASQAGEDDQWIARTSEIEAAPNQLRCVLLGYDVADRYLTSSTPHVVACPNARFAHSLNEFGLIAHRTVAHEAADWSNGAIPEHSPFFVFRIELVAEYGRPDAG